MPQRMVGAHVKHVYIKCKNILTKILKDVGIEVPKGIETRSKCSIACRQKQGMITCNNHNMRNPF